MTCNPRPDEILEQDPQANLDYGFDWNDDGHGNLGYLGDDTLSGSSWSVNKTGLVLGTQTSDDTTTTVWLSGGTLGEGYTVTNHIITTEGREDDRSFRVVIKNK